MNRRTDDYSDLAYTYVVWPEQTGWVASILGQPWTAVYGNTPEEAITLLQTSLPAMLLASAERGFQLPGTGESESSEGFLTARIAPELHRQFVRLARARQVSKDLLLAEALRLFIADAGQDQITSQVETAAAPGTADDEPEQPQPRGRTAHRLVLAPPDAEAPPLFQPYRKTPRRLELDPTVPALQESERRGRRRRRSLDGPNEE